ncbi:MAG: DUF3048 domain-containing protein [Actinomycetota bacterium]
MALSRRGIAATVASIVLLGGAIAAGLVFIGGRGIGPLADAGDVSSPPAPPPVCPLTGVQRKVPNRPALAVKVENIPSVRPQIGLSHADIIYEEPVEAGITRFIVIYQCEGSERVEPIRSARLTDPSILRQFGRPVFAYAGGVPQVVSAVRRAGLIDVNFVKDPSAYHRDPARLSPHNLFASTADLYAAADSPTGVPDPVFSYSPTRPKAKRIHEIHIPFSSSSDVYWRWSSDKRAWVRSHGDVPHTYSDGTQVNARNVVVQVVKLRDTGIVDVNGVASPEVVATGKGTAFVLRNGRMIKGTWVRDSEDDITKFLDSKGQEIPLDIGNTWVELVPNDIPTTTS